MHFFRTVSLTAIIGMAGTIAPGAAFAAPRDSWLGAWAHPPTAYNMTAIASIARPDGTTRIVRPSYAPLSPYNDVTVREVTRLATGARRIRLRFSNEFGARPVILGSAHVALAGEKGAILAGSDHVLTFAGKASVEIPPGAPIVSDPVDWALPAFAKLAVSVFYPGETVPPAHTLFALDAYAAASPGDQTGAETMPAAAQARSGNHVSEIEIVPAVARRVLVAFGDSVTEGVGSTAGRFRGWPDRLAERLAGATATRDWSVVNAGIGSNRLLHDTPSANALSRFDRDVLAVPGVAAVIMLLGINDIQYSHRNPDELVHADRIIDAMRQLAERAHSRGIQIFGATITPFEGSPDYTDEGEADRQAVNQWIRTTGLLDRVVDFDAAMRDPTHLSRLRENVDGGGHLHPNDGGYAVMGDAVDLGLFVRHTRVDDPASFGQVSPEALALH